jgi:methionyl-tRNA formyltransferase
LKELDRLPGINQTARVIVLTSGNDFAQRILVGLALEQVAVEALFLVDQPRSSNRQAAGVRRFLHRPSPRRIAVAALRRALRVAELPQAEPPDPWAGLAGEVRRIGPLNGEAMQAALRESPPDYLVLGGVGIVGAEALAIPRQGTFNVHPGLLPWIRGVGVIERAIDRQVPVGLTAHYVNAGIDTGAIIHRELVPVQPYDTLTSLRKKAYERCAQVMVETVVAAVRGGTPEAFPQTRRFPYCKEPTAREYASIDERVREGLALDLYRRWHEALGSHDLPAGLEQDPTRPTEAVSMGATADRSP